MANNWQKFARMAVALGSVLSVIPAAAQNVTETLPAEEEVVEDVRYYSVEVIVFEYASSVSAGNEVFDPVEPEETELVALDPNTGIPVYGDMTTDASVASVGNDSIEFGDYEEFVEEEITELTSIPSMLNIEFRLLTEEELTMSEIHEQLLRLDAYLPVLWGGWVQSTHEKDLTPPIRLRTLGTPPLHIDGTLTLYLKNYLHLAVDLTREQHIAALQPVYRMEKPGRNSGRSSFEYDLDYNVSNRQTIIYHIQEDRLFNSGQLRYYDHPKFGVLARVTRVEIADPQDNDEDEEPLAGRSMLSSTR